MIFVPQKVRTYNYAISYVNDHYVHIAQVLFRFACKVLKERMVL